MLGAIGAIVAASVDFDLATALPLLLAVLALAGGVRPLLERIKLPPIDGDHEIRR